MNKEKEIVDVIETPETNYLEQIEALKNERDRMVSLEEYNKVLGENKKLTNDYINKRQPVVEEKKTMRSPLEITKEMSNQKQELTNRKYVELAVEYRDAYLDVTGKDPFAKDQTAPTADSVEVYNAFKQVLADSPDAATFRFNIDRILHDDRSTLQAINARNKRK